MDKKKIIYFLICAPVILLAFLNLLTVFTPEIGFDALWYHLTLPKLWLFKHQWFFGGGLLYYSVMPRLTETIYIPLIKYFGFIGPKALLFLSGIGTSIVIWKISQKLKLSKILSLLAVSLFYCTWLVSWQSGSSYIDLFRTFLESLALLFLISGSWFKGGVFLGLSVGTKWLSLYSVVLYSIIFNPLALIPALFLSAPWAAVAFKFTGNLFYPLFDPILHNSFSAPLIILKRWLLLPFTLTIPFDDFLSPMVFVLVILAVLSLFSRNKTIREISLVGVLGAMFSVSLNPPSSRYFLPFFPAIILAGLSLVNQLKPKLQQVFLILTIISSIFILGLRVSADRKYLPYLLGKQNLEAFLTSLHGRLPDTFIDSDGFVRKEIPQDSKIIIDKLHNLYYFPYNFDHTSWANIYSDYDYLVTKDTLPQEINGKLIHTNELGIQVYQLK